MSDQLHRMHPHKEHTVWVRCLTKSMSKIPAQKDIEFTTQEGKLYVLQCRSGKRTAKAAVKVAVDMVRACVHVCMCMPPDGHGPFRGLTRLHAHTTGPGGPHLARRGAATRQRQGHGLFPPPVRYVPCHSSDRPFLSFPSHSLTYTRHRHPTTRTGRSTPRRPRPSSPRACPPAPASAPAGSSSTARKRRRRPRQVVLAVLSVLVLPADQTNQHLD